MDTQLIDKSFRLKNITLLTAIGGAGKTTLAMEYAKQFSRKENSVVVWIYADNQEKVDSKLQDIIINNLKTPKEEIAQMSSQAKIDVITNHVRFEKTPHLFVFDNIEENEMETIRLFSNSIIPTNLKILLTSRNKSIKDIFELEITMLSLNGVETVQAKQYFVDRISSKLEKDTIEEIFELSLIHI